MSYLQSLLPVCLCLAMIWPSWGQRDCCCTQSPQIATASVDFTSLPPCCAARVKAQASSQATRPAIPGWRAHCACQPEWHAAEYTLTPRSQFTQVGTSPDWLYVAVVNQADFVPCDVIWSDASGVDLGGPAKCIRLSRWLA